MNQDVSRNRMLFCKEAGKVKGGKLENWFSIKDTNRRLVVGEDEVRRIWRDYFEDLYNINTEEQVAVQEKKK